MVDLARYMVFDHAPGSTAWVVLGEARDVLARAHATIHEKAEVRAAGGRAGGRRRRLWGGGRWAARAGSRAVVACLGSCAGRRGSVHHPHLFHPSPRLNQPLHPPKLQTPTQRKRIEREERLKHESRERNKIRAAIEADRADRADRSQMAAEGAAAAAAAALAAQRAEAAAAHAAAAAGAPGGSPGSPRGRPKVA